MATTPILRTNPAPRSATGEMARIAEGERARAFRTTDIAGNVVDLADYLTDTSCSRSSASRRARICNLRVHRMIERYPAYHDAGMAMIAVFESPRAAMLRYVAGRMDAPFPLIADPEDRLYRLYGLEKSWGKFAMAYINPRAAAKSFRDACRRRIRQGVLAGQDRRGPPPHAGRFPHRAGYDRAESMVRHVSRRPSPV